MLSEISFVDELRCEVGFFAALEMMFRDAHGRLFSSIKNNLLSFYVSRMSIFSDRRAFRKSQKGGFGLNLSKYS